MYKIQPKSNFKKTLEEIAENMPVSALNFSFNYITYFTIVFNLKTIISYKNNKQLYAQETETNIETITGI